MEDKVVDILASKSPVSSNNIFIDLVILLFILLVVYLWKYSISGILNKEIAVKTRGIKPETVKGKQAVRISIYFLIGAIASTLVIISIIFDLFITWDI